MLLFLAITAWTGDVYAQVSPPDTLAAQPDTLRLPAAQKGDIETTIVYSARDSIRFDVVNKIMYLYGDAKIDYGTTSLAAEQIQINWGINTLFANGVPDSTGKLRGIPLFKDDADQYEAEHIAYNYKTKRGKISGATTKQGEGYIHAETVKKNANNELFGLNAQYTTCDLKHPHYFVNAHKMKVGADRKVYSGPFNLWVGDIPTPLGFLFGMFPSPQKERASGIIIPKFGRTLLQGLYLREGGYYWAVNDYIGMKFLGDVYSFGGGGGAIQTDYYKRYRYRGGLNVRYNFIPAPDQLEQNASVGLNQTRVLETQSFWISWNHNPEPRNGATFRANVNAGTPNFNQQYSRNVGNYLAPAFNSTISYSRVLQSAPINYNITVSQSQTSDGLMSFSLPEFTLGTNRIYPLRGLNEVPKGRWYEGFMNQFGIDYRLSAAHKFSNDFPQDRITLFEEFPDSTYRPLTLNATNLSRILNNSHDGAQHLFGITLGSYKVLKHFSLTPTINYSESWYLESLRYRFNNQRNRLDIDTVSGFNRVYEYSAGASLNTRFYGMYYTKGRIQAIRHVVNPELRFDYRPNFAAPDYNYYQWVQTDVNGRFEPISRYQGFLYSTPGRGRRQNLAFGVSNSLEMKVKTKNDTLTTFEKIKLIDNLSVRGSYNFAADSFNLSNIAVSMNTMLYNRISIFTNLNFDPYKYVTTNETARQTPELLINSSKFRLAQLATATFTASTDLNPESWRRQKKTATTNIPFPLENNTTGAAQFPEYVDFDIPWTLFLDFTANYQNPNIIRQNAPSLAKSLTVRGTVNPTSKWKVGYSSGYDFTNKTITVTSFDIYRDLHCWEMSIGWRPFGYSQGYFVNINVKSSMLRDLKISRNQSPQNRF